MSLESISSGCPLPFLWCLPSPCPLRQLATQTGMPPYPPAVCSACSPVTMAAGSRASAVRSHPRVMKHAAAVLECRLAFFSPASFLPHLLQSTTASHPLPAHRRSQLRCCRMPFKLISWAAQPYLYFSGDTVPLMMTGGLSDNKADVMGKPATSHPWVGKSS